MLWWFKHLHVITFLTNYTLKCPVLHVFFEALNVFIVCNITCVHVSHVKHCLSVYCCFHCPKNGPMSSLFYEVPPSEIRNEFWLHQRTAVLLLDSSLSHVAWKGHASYHKLEIHAQLKCFFLCGSAKRPRPLFFVFLVTAVCFERGLLLNKISR